MSCLHISSPNFMPSVLTASSLSCEDDEGKGGEGKGVQKKFMRRGRISMKAGEQFEWRIERNITDAKK
jgi:hypothetical protein